MHCLKYFPTGYIVKSAKKSVSLSYTTSWSAHNISYFEKLN